MIMKLLYTTEYTFMCWQHKVLNKYFFRQDRSLHNSTSSSTSALLCVMLLNYLVVIISSIIIAIIIILNISIIIIILLILIILTPSFLLSILPLIFWIQRVFSRLISTPFHTLLHPCPLHQKEYNTISGMPSTCRGRRTHRLVLGRNGTGASGGLQAQGWDASLAPAVKRVATIVQAVHVEPTPPHLTTFTNFANFKTLHLTNFKVCIFTQKLEDTWILHRFEETGILHPRIYKIWTRELEDVAPAPAYFWDFEPADLKLQIRYPHICKVAFSLETLEITIVSKYLITNHFSLINNALWSSGIAGFSGLHHTIQVSFSWATMCSSYSIAALTALWLISRTGVTTWRGSRAAAVQPLHHSGLN